jgi:hypothetical protein
MIKARLFKWLCNSTKQYIKSKALASNYQHGIYMVGSDMTPSVSLEHSLSGTAYSGSSAYSWSKLGSVARDSTHA